MSIAEMVGTEREENFTAEGMLLTDVGGLLETGVLSTPGMIGMMERNCAILVQEFLPEIAEGEVSLVYFDGVFSHAIRKCPPAGEFRVNSRFGATRAAETPTDGVIRQGAAALGVHREPVTQVGPVLGSDEDAAARGGQGERPRRVPRRRARPDRRARGVRRQAS